MCTTLTSPTVVKSTAGRYGGVNYAMHHYFISCEGLPMQTVDYELNKTESLKLYLSPMGGAASFPDITSPKHKMGNRYRQRDRKGKIIEDPGRGHQLRRRYHIFTPKLYPTNFAKDVILALYPRSLTLSDSKHRFRAPFTV
ncbi:hypothetical protein BDR07DRAFT_1458792 [Suillus spraguei]|nr:hypothetical protein BDR07DRAFT_1458792 [Suillus spraguei]